MLVRLRFWLSTAVVGVGLGVFQTISLPLPVVVLGMKSSRALSMVVLGKSGRSHEGSTPDVWVMVAFCLVVPRPKGSVWGFRISVFDVRLVAVVMA